LARSRLLPALAGLGVLILAVLALTVWRAPLVALFTQQGQLEALVQRLGPAGPLAIIALQAAQVLLAPIPGQFVGLASGYLFGPWLGTLYSMAGLTLGSYLGAWLARRWGRPLVARLLSPATLARADRISGRLGLPLLFVVFAVPFLPDDAILFVAGLTSLSLAGIVAAAFFGRLPGVLVSSWLGANAGQMSPLQWAAAVAVTLAVAIPLYRWRDALERHMWSLLERFSRRPGEAPNPPHSHEDTET